MDSSRALLAVLGLLALEAIGTTSVQAGPRAGPDGVTIDRDEWGVPHIFASTEASGYFGLGYAFSEDRFERLVNLILLARGELASRMGSAALETDVQVRLWRTREMSTLGLNQISPQLRENYAAFAAGVRAFVTKSHPDPKLAAIANSVTVIDLIAIPRAGVYAFYHAAAARAECRVDGMSYSKAFLPYNAHSPEGPASNGWVVAPIRTAEKALILAADPHVDNESIAYYEYHIEAGGLKSAGYSFGPALWQAHNEDVAWAMTTGSSDYLDCYAIETESDDPRRYLYDGLSKRMEERSETFQVAGAAPVTREFEYAILNGRPSPVISRKGSIAYVASTGDMDRAGFLSEEIYRMNKARSIDDVRRALSTMSMLPQNLIVGDRRGEILFLREGRAPIRPTGYDWTGPVPGNTSKTAWLGYHTLRDLVQIRDPSSGYLENNNTAPDTMAVEPLLDSRKYPLDLFYDTPGRMTSRAVRANAVLERNSSMTFADATALAFDEMWVTAADWVAGLRYAVTVRPDVVANMSTAVRDAIDRLTSFDGRADKDSQAATDYYFWRQAADPAISKLDHGAFIDWPWDPSRFSPAFADLLLTALQKSLERREAAYGTTRQSFGEIMRAGRGKIDAPTGGVTIDSDAVPLCVEQVRAVCERTMRAFGIAPVGDKGQFRVTRGSQAMRLIQFTNPLRAFTLYAFGQSDDPSSAHYADQARLFSEKQMKPAYFSRAELKGHVTSEERLAMPSMPH